MKARTCDRSWQAEEREDGRLPERAAASFEAHAALCDVCQHEVRALQRLRTLGAQLPSAESTQLDRRRLRNQLLGRANALTLGTSRPIRNRVAAAVVGLGTAAVLAFRLAAPPPSGSSTEPHAVGAPVFRIETSQGAQW